MRRSIRHRACPEGANVSTVTRRRCTHCPLCAVGPGVAGCPLAGGVANSRARRKPATIASSAARRSSRSGTRTVAEGCTVATMGGPSAEVSTWPRSDVIARALPSTARTAVVPIATTTAGCTWAISSPSPQRARLDLGGVGALVDATFAAGFPLEMLDRVGDVYGAAVDPAVSSASSRTRRAGPTNGAPRPGRTPMRTAHPRQHMTPAGSCPGGAG